MGLGEGVTEGLHGDADEGEFGEGTSAKANAADPFHPGVKRGMVGRAGVVPSEQGIGIEEMAHGKSARAASICSCVTWGPGAAL